MGDLPARSWARMHLVFRRSVCSDWFMSGAGCDMMGFGLYDLRHSSIVIV